MAARLVRSDIQAALVIVGAGVLVRLLLLLLIVDPLVDPLGGDARYYLQVAGNIWSHGVHAEAPDLRPTSFRVPGYPLFLAPLVGAGLSIPAILAVQCAFTIAVALVSFAMLRSGDRALAFVVGLLIAANPFQAIYDFRLLSESLYVGLLWLAWLTLYRGGGWAAAAWAGLLLGLAILTRDTLLLLGLFAVPFAVLAGRQWRRFGLHLTLVAAISLLTVGPWIARNQAVTGEASLGQGRLGLNLWVGTWERNGDWVRDGMGRPAFPAEAFRSPGEESAVRRAWFANDDRALRNVALSRMAEDPVEVLESWAVRYPRMWIGTRSDQIAFRAAPESMVWTGAKTALFGLNAAMLLLALAGLGLALRRRSRLAMFAIPVAYVGLVYLPFHNVETRYSLAALPFLLMFASFAAVEAGRARNSRRASSAA